MFHTGVVFWSEMVSWSVCTRPGTDSLQPDHCLWEISAHPHHLCCCYSGCEEVRAALSSSACHSMGHSHGACAWWHRAMRGQDTSGAADRQTGIQPRAVTICGCWETICLPPNFSSQTHQHVGSMDDCGLDSCEKFSPTVQTHLLGTCCHCQC